VWSGRGGYLRRGKRIRDERFESVRGECDFEGIGVSSIFRFIRSVVRDLTKMFPTLDLSWD
jgi:hypothetical protein